MIAPIVRTIPYQTGVEFLKGSLFPVALISLNFSSGNVFMWTGTQTLNWANYNWTGVGSLGKIGVIEETLELRAIGLQLELSGIPSTVLDIALRENFQGRTAQVWIATLNDQMQLTGEPFQIFAGYMDTMELTEGSSASIKLSLESKLFDLERARVRRYTAEDQRAQYPGDAGLDAVAALQEKQILWGQA